VRELAERAYYQLCLALGRLLRAARYSTTRIESIDGELRVRKRRAPHAPLLVCLGGPLTRILGTGVRVLPQREWEARERVVYGSVHGRSILIEADGSLVLPRLAGATLAAVLEDPALDEPMRRHAITLAVDALARFHALGFTHGDAMPENVLVDLDAGVAHWFDFETVHDAGRRAAWSRADDVRALLDGCVLRTTPERLVDTLELILATYGDGEVIRVLATSFTTVWRRSLAFHVGQAGLRFPSRREIARLLAVRAGTSSRGAPC
jgi:serine/threonine protein kinase